ncbi:MAG: radical SAM protein, partial [Candidatus Aenigmatarchaeota archaeon]
SALDSLPKLLECVEEDKTDKIKNIEGIAFREDGEVIVNYPKNLDKKLDETPWPDRDVIDNSLYSSMPSKNDSFTIVMASTGCKYNCNFCCLGNLGYSKRDAEDVVDEIEEAVNKHEIDTISFMDDDFLGDKKLAREISKKIIEREIEFRWICSSRIDHIDKKTLQLMEKAGCIYIFFGIESGSQKILNNINKGITIDQIKEAVKLTKVVGINTAGYFMIGHPGETEKEVKKTIKLAKELPLDYAQFLKTVARPGTNLYEDVKEELGYDYFEKLIKGEVEPMELPTPWTDLSNEEINKWIIKALNSFYLRPSFILHKLIATKSFKNIKNYAKIGLDILKSGI